MKFARKYLAPVSLLLVSMIGAAYAAATLFTQTFPAIPAPAPNPAVGATCTTLNASISSVTPGSSGSVLFDCIISVPSCVCPAFSATSTTTATPTFTLPIGYIALGIIAHLKDTCGATLTNPITSGSPVTLAGGGFYDYCAEFSNAPSTGLGTFSVSWSQ